MEDAVLAYYRGLFRKGFTNAGSIENASMYLETYGENSPVCGSTDDFMDLYVRVVNNAIEDIRYQCICCPTTNVAVEILCDLVKGKSLDEAAVITADAFPQFLDYEDKLLRKKAQALLEFLNNGIVDYKVRKGKTG